ncbi:hypothetical protein QE152_g25777 [Popillia japonica]|uniref:Uncharacterized protein n=1 Tax=Popillia japonica TaxID=7064 RepID=A0AAW1K047_POPJA
MKVFVLLVVLAGFAMASKHFNGLTKLFIYKKHPSSEGECDFFQCRYNRSEPNFCLKYDTGEVVEVRGHCMVIKAICWSNSDAPAEVVPMKLCDEAYPIYLPARRSVNR